MNYKKEYQKVIKELEVLKRALRRKGDVVEMISKKLGLFKDESFKFQLSRMNSNELYLLYNKLEEGVSK